MTSTVQLKSSSWRESSGYLALRSGLAAFALFALVSCSSAVDGEDVESVASQSAAPSSSPTPSTVTPEFCEPATAIGREATPVGGPKEYLERKKYTLTLETNCGVIEIAADAQKAPVTVTTIGYLANAKFYDATLCQRVTTSGIFVIQCGDPTDTRAGGPGFTFKDENLPAASESNYPKGTVAMANTGPNTNGSQFFFVYKDTTLGPNYTIWGEVIKGMDILEKIAALGTADGGPDGKPKFPFEIRSARLS